MKKLINGLMLVLLTTVTGCVQTDSAQLSRSTQLAISSVRDLPITYPAGSTFSLVPKHSEKVSATKAQMKAAYDVYAKQIIVYLEARGYHHTTNEKPNFYVGYGLALDKDLSDQAISQKFGVLPGLPASDDLEKGSFLIYIEDTAIAKRVWRGAIQGFVQDEFSQQDREQRAAHIVNAVLKQFYVSN